MPRLQMRTNILLEVGGINKLSTEVARLALSNPLLVTDPGLSKLGLAKRCQLLCPSLTIYDQTPSNPTESAAKSAAAMYREFGCDGVVALGGGSAMDLGKAVSILVSNEGDLADYDVTRIDPKSVGEPPPLLVIPTTSGTGTEVSVGCVIILDNGHKAIIDSDELIPTAVICDPELTLSLPQRLTAATGIDALSHCIEGYCSNISNPLTKPIALDGVRRISAALTRAINEPSSIEARTDLMIGSLQGGLAMTMELGAAHAMSVPLGEQFHEHHGELTGAMLGSAMRFNEPHQSTAMKEIRTAMGVPKNANIRDWMNGFCENLGLRIRLRDMGVTAEALEQIATKASNSVFNDTNFRTGSAEEYLSMLTAQF